MSTSYEKLIEDLVASGKLKSYETISRHNPKRRLFLTERAVKEVSNSALQMLAGKPKILGALDTWALGQWITGTKRRGEFLVPLYPPPPDVWEIKVRAPTIEGRLFVRFVCPDTLVMTHTHTRGHLDSGFNEAMEECVTAWNELFPGMIPFKGNSIHDYITSKSDDFPHIARKPKRR